MKLGRSQGLLIEWARLEALHYERGSMDRNHKECQLILQTYITSYLYLCGGIHYT